MRIWAALIIGGALLAYGLTQPAPVPTPAAGTRLADLFPATRTVATKPIQTPMPPPRPASGTGAARVPPPPRQAIGGTAVHPVPAPFPSPTKRTAEALTAAAIAALIVQENRRAYYTTGRPCACPDDAMRNGRQCGTRSTYSRPGGASPLCYPTDVSDAMIRSYRARIAER